VQTASKLGSRSMQEWQSWTKAVPASDYPCRNNLKRYNMLFGNIQESFREMEEYF
jgi:hypothetical protein